MLGAFACLPAAALAATEEAEPQRPRFKISAAQLHSTLSERFPLRFGVDDFLQVEVSAPSLHLLPGRNRLGAGLVAQASGPMLPQAPPGQLDVSFGLRYAPQDRTVRAHDPELLDLRLPGVPADAIAPLQQMFIAMTRRAMGDVVVHRFTERDLALADTMGFEPDRLEVMPDGLMIVFGEKRRS